MNPLIIERSESRWVTDIATWPTITIAVTHARTSWTNVAPSRGATDKKQDHCGTKLGVELDDDRRRNEDGVEPLARIELD